MSARIDSREVGRDVTRAAGVADRLSHAWHQALGLGGGLESPREHRFTPDRKRGFRVEEIGEPGCPYLKRWVLQLGAFSVRLHHWRASDDPRVMHDHPWWFATLVLRGGYRDLSPGPNYDARFDNPDLDGTYPSRALPGWIEVDRLRPGSFRYRPAEHTHTVQVNPGGCWSLLVTGPNARDWGFHTATGWLRQRAYFREHGHHPCED